METYQNICKIVFILTFGVIGMYFAQYATITSLAGQISLGLTAGHAIGALFIIGMITDQ